MAEATGSRNVSIYRQMLGGREGVLFIFSCSVRLAPSAGTGRTTKAGSVILLVLVINGCAYKIKVKSSSFGDG